MKTLITYKSTYGSSKQYALWLGEELKCSEAIEFKNHLFSHFERVDKKWIEPILEYIKN